MFKAGLFLTLIYMASSAANLECWSGMRANDSDTSTLTKKNCTGDQTKYQCTKIKKGSKLTYDCALNTATCDPAAGCTNSSEQLGNAFSCYSEKDSSKPVACSDKVKSCQRKDEKNVVTYSCGSCDTATCISCTTELCNFEPGKCTTDGTVSKSCTYSKSDGCLTKATATGNKTTVTYACGMCKQTGGKDEAGCMSCKDDDCNTAAKSFWCFSDTLNLTKNGTDTKVLTMCTDKSKGCFTKTDENKTATVSGKVSTGCVETSVCTGANCKVCKTNGCNYYIVSQACAPVAGIAVLLQLLVMLTALY